MTLKRLEMHGFKSFAKKAVFDFSAPVTAIVGPNGSGKSNVVESIRFVLGEQSTKSMRSKTGADLIFKGSKQLGKMSRASVAITFDNTKRIFNLPSLEHGNNSLDFDEITIMREVFSDGMNKYSLNGNEVRLKDIHELIASVNIGSSGHHIISQGEADRLLNAKPSERREMLEESLGLKLYHYRIKESERKMEKTRDHLREAESLRRELAPHLRFLKKQVEKIEKARELEQSLLGYYETYFVQEQTLLVRMEQELALERDLVAQRLESLSHQLDEHGQNLSESRIQEIDTMIHEVRTEMRSLQSQRDDISRQIGRIEGMIESAQRIAPKQQPVATVSIGDIEQLIVECEQSAYDASQIIQKLKSLIATKTTDDTTIIVDTSEFEITKSDLEKQIHDCDASIQLCNEKIVEYQNQIETIRRSDQDRQRVFYELQTQKHDLVSQQSMIASRQSHITERHHRLAEEYIQAEHLVGARILDLKQVYLESSYDIDESALRTLHHDIERTKIRLEDMGGGSGGDVLAEYDETITRDAYLEQQIQDLNSALSALETTIAELKQKLGQEFHAGIVKINKEFENFFRLMFGGGDARLAVVDVEKRKKKSEVDEEGNEISSDDESSEKEQGIDIDVSLPRKKVKDLEMLSGGERSLTSIALLFALSQVNPPPFLVLDETDAALDEANSQKYGDMIENLAKETQLVVVTHNRETMSRADILYGVTLGSDDCSTLLSIKFEEAVKVAK